jgi:pyridoxine 5'-phosphate synthase PdxJ
MGISCHIFNAFKFSLLFSACGVSVMSSMQLNHGCTALLGGEREELTTEGGLDVVSQISRMTDVCAQLKASDIVTLSAPDFSHNNAPATGDG